MRRDIPVFITTTLIVLGAGVAITSPSPIEAMALWVAAFALVVLLSILIAEVRAARRSRERGA